MSSTAVFRKGEGWSFSSLVPEMFGMMSEYGNKN
jgi:hypothetical protein